MSRASVLSVAPKWFVRDFLAVREIVFSSWFNLLLVCVPLGWASAYLKWGSVTTFTLVGRAVAALTLPPLRRNARPPPPHTCQSDTSPSARNRPPAGLHALITPIFAARDHLRPQPRTEKTN